jgi:hypothetical protein
MAASSSTILSTSCITLSSDYASLKTPTYWNEHIHDSYEKQNDEGESRENNEDI